MEYKIVTNQYYGQLTSDVNDLIKSGWNPQGGIAVTRDDSGNTWFYQAMIKETK